MGHCQGDPENYGCEARVKAIIVSTFQDTVTGEKTEKICIEVMKANK